MLCRFEMPPFVNISLAVKYTVFVFVEIWHFGSIPVKREILENLDWYMVGNWYSCLFLVGNSVMYCICHLFLVGNTSWAF